MQILVKFPTRERPQKAIRRIEEYKLLADNPANVHILVSYDFKDHTTDNPIVLSKIKQLGALAIGGVSKNKIHAINRDLEHAPRGAWDIIVLASDDMECQVKGWDTIIIREMQENFPDLDGCLFHWDGDANTLRHNNYQGLCTMNIMGEKYFYESSSHHGKLYHDDYVSLWCDNEFTDVAQRQNKMYKSEVVLFKHNHYSNNGQKPDALMQRTQRYYKIDEATYNRRKRLNFPQ